MKGDNARAGYLLYKESGHWSRCGLASSLCLPSHPLSSGVPLGQIKEDHFPILTQVAYQLIISLNDVFCCSFIWKPAVSAIVIVSLHIMYLLFAYVFLYLCTYPLMPFCIMSRQIPCRLEWIKIVHSWKKKPQKEEATLYVFDVV